MYHVESVRKSTASHSMDEEENTLMQDAILYLQKKTYRVGLSKNEKRIVRRKAEKFSLKTGELLYTKKDKTKVDSDSQVILL